MNNIIKEDETTFFIEINDIKQLNAEDYQEFEQYISTHGWMRLDKKRLRVVLYKADDDVISWLNEHKHFHHEDDVYYLVSDVKRSDVKNKIIKFFEAEGYDRRKSNWRGESRDKMIYVKRL